jgi:hypothetical protein
MGEKGGSTSQGRRRAVMAHLPLERYACCVPYPECFVMCRQGLLLPESIFSFGARHGGLQTRAMSRC